MRQSPEVDTHISPWGRSTVVALIVLGVAFVVAPLFVMAQEASADLKAQIREDLSNDPRSANLTEAEINALVESISKAAIEQGVAEEYLESRNTIDYSEEFAAQQTVPHSQYPTPFILWSAGGLFLLLILLILWRAHGPRTPEEPVAVA